MSDLENLNGRVAIVTGATAGIGRDLCARLAQAGAKVAAVGRSEERLAEVVAEIEQRAPGADVLALRTDVTSEPEVEAMAQAALDEWGRIDILIASAGVLRAQGKGLETLQRMSLESFSEVLDTNLKGVFLTNRAVLSTMMRQRSGHIVNLSSTSGRTAYAFDTAYCASKYGVIGLTEALAQEVEGRGIKVEALLPGAIDTPIWDQNGPIRPPAAALPPERVADMVLHMLTLPDDVWLLTPMIEPLARPEASGWRAGPKTAPPSSSTPGASS